MSELGSKQKDFRVEAHKAILDMFAKFTGLPIGLFDRGGGELKGTFSTGSLDNFEKHCKFIRSFPGGKEACERDQCHRAKTAFLNKQPRLMCCHAGIWNQILPIVFEGDVRAVLLFGETLIESPEYMDETIQRHYKVMADLNLGEKDREELGQLLFQAKRHSLKDIERYMDGISPIEQYLYNLIEQEQRMQNNLEKAAHDLQTRLQSLIGQAENLMVEAPYLKTGEIREMSHGLLSKAEAMATVVNNLGDFRQAYRFRSEKLRPLFIEAWRIYQEEAEERNIGFRVNFAPVDGREVELEISRQHLELAVNNLIHNAIKYSFSGMPGRKRYIEVKGQYEDVYYKISISNFGIGIEPDEINEGKIFEDGYQGRLTQGEFRTGSGKGLTYVKRVIEHHSGKINLESTRMGDPEELHGQPYLNTFFIHLPFKQKSDKGDS
jgi:signal transduction histidine kinase